MKFLKIFLAALLAVVVGGILSTILWVVILASMTASLGGTTQSVITPNTIVKIDLAENITDAPSRNPMSGFDFMSMSMTYSTNLLKVLQSIEAAAADDRVKGIYLNFTGMGGVSSGGAEEIRAALLKFKESGKFIVAYNENYTQGSYFLASVADKIYMQPEGSFSWHGISSSTAFFKGAFDKLGLSAEVFRPTSCTYKSAVEPYIRKNMSPENRAQMQMMVDDMWEVFVESVAQSRNLDAKRLERLADNLEVSFPEEALKHGFIDGIIYESDMEGIFTELGVERQADNSFNIVSLGEYITLSPATPLFTGPAVGVVYAEGEVRDGEGEDDNVYGANVAALLKQAREDDDIKAVVFRVNSPGGSALASDVIWKEVVLLQEKKPVVVSMGSYAASGGYYISAPADVILANRLTLTGSIGVFGLRFEGGDLLSRKLGITTDRVKSNKMSDFGGENLFGLATRKLSPQENKLMIRSVDKVYEAFTSKVASGRNLPIEKVLKISQGRVWSGKQAVSLGLADMNGGLREAITIAADRAGLSDGFRIVEVLEELSPMNMFMQQLNSGAVSILLDDETAEVVEEYNALKSSLVREGVQAFCPYTVNF